MFIPKALASGSRCGACNYGLLRSFASIGGLSLDALPPLPSSRQGAYTKRSLAQRRPLHFSVQHRWSHDIDSDNTRAEAQGGSVPQAKHVNEERVSNRPAVPWYLQVETPRPAVYPRLDRERLPDLPTDPPPILEPLLKYASIDLGLDDLSLLDLRELDPPPALGANLLMVFGTARSEKHLHVSADRFCRWLRSNHKLTPFADGLLGRNELKLKLRRKARRAKLLGGAGASRRADPDDGIRTGWVCVNVGTVDAGTAAHEELVPAAEFIGFGSRAGGVKIVVQMLTEEKRGELDLEDLWSGMKRRQAKKAQINAAAGIDQGVIEEVDSNVEINGYEIA